MTGKILKGLCDECSLCCEYVSIEIDAPKNWKDIDEIRWFLLHEIPVFIDIDDTWNVRINKKCTALNSHGECGIYMSRPEICREYQHKDCERYAGLPKKTFYKADEFIAFVDNDPVLKKMYSEKPKDRS